MTVGPGHENEYVIGFDPEKCIQCHGCEVACRAWRELDHGVHYRRVLNVWHGTYPQVKSASVSLACLHCVEPACLAACPEGAITKRAADGLVVVDETLCTGCEICAEACAFGVPQFADGGTMRKCDLCSGRQVARTAPPCVDTCPGQALALIKVSRSEKMAREEDTAKLLGDFFNSNRTNF
jgi:anaerobic dimethyl sulfoxide reductase subunit B (iron-sulfur subunit)